MWTALLPIVIGLLMIVAGGTLSYIGCGEFRKGFEEKFTARIQEEVEKSRSVEHRITVGEGFNGTLTTPDGIYVVGCSYSIPDEDREFKIERCANENMTTYHSRVKEITEKQKAKIFSTEGVTGFHNSPYEITVEKAELFSWEGIDKKMRKMLTE